MRAAWFASNRRVRAGSCALAGLLAFAGLLAALAGPTSARAAWVWVEGEKPIRSTMQRHPWWYDQVKRELLSGGDFTSNFNDKAPGEATYQVNIPQAGEYEFWVRANPLMSRLSYKLNDGPWTLIDLEKTQQGATNIAADGKPDLRFIAWSRAGKVKLSRGVSYVRFLMDSKNNNHGYLDCFVLTNEPFTPDGTTKPDQAAAASRRAEDENRGWFTFAPKPDSFAISSGIDLRWLNEKEAGENGFIAVRDGRFVHSKTGHSVRFWAVNGPPGKDREELRRDARMLAKRGVNMVRVHHGYFDKDGNVDPSAVAQAHDVVAAMKAEGVYTHFSIYFPLWLQPAPGTTWLPGYDGNKHPFAALFFKPEFQKKYQSWWTALLTTPSRTTGKRLIDEPAVAGAEIINEDSYLFWTFSPANIPDPELRVLEAKFGDWMKQQLGSLDAVSRRWGGLRDPRDKPAEGRLGFRPLWNMANERTPRDKDTARFLVQSQRGFYEQMYRFLRNLGFKGVITASNWATADPRVLGPLEKYTYTAGDFIDRHGYFAGTHTGEHSAWSLRDGQVYSDRSALRFEPAEPGKPKLFVHPAMDIHYDGKPSMISETTWNRPNRYRSEAPLYLASYGALQGSDAIVHFAHDTSNWTVKPGFFMQPWTLMTPAMMGQFPAAALIYRKGLVAEGDVLVSLNLKLGDLLDLNGTPLPQDAAFDELWLKDVPKGLTLRPGNVIDPLVHLVGRTSVIFSDRGGPAVLKDLRPYIDRTKHTVTSTSGQLRLDYGKGLLTINAPAAQGVSGTLREAGTSDLADLTITSALDLGHIVAVSLDGEPLATSKKILLQVMSEEKALDFRTEPAAGGLRKIVSVGRDPWLVKRFEGAVRFKRSDAGKLKVTALDENGEPLKSVTGASEILLGSRVLYYLIEPGASVASAR
jgi:hypothetical protein